MTSRMTLGDTSDRSRGLRPPFSLRGRCIIVYTTRYLSSIVGAVLGEDAVDLRLLDGAEHQRLPVVTGPVVQAPHTDPGEVDAV